MTTKLTMVVEITVDCPKDDVEHSVLGMAVAEAMLRLAQSKHVKSGTELVLNSGRTDTTTCINVLSFGLRVGV